ncbi:hypothetical protein [Sulfurospirillum sp. 1612]|uniref:hypothetical protein n=1 Tax=Sulfurospirillum sp. 1612 TaxID=3094835 RepID=UPI002F93ABDF
MDPNKFIKITNSNEFEIKVSYPADENKKKTQYNISIYMFLPESLGIDEQTYSKQAFYSHYLGYIRLITPEYNVQTLSKRLSNLIEFFKTGMNEEEKFEYINYEIKMIVCSYVNYLKDFTHNIEDNGVDAEKMRIFVEDIKKFDDLKIEIFTLSNASKQDNIKHLISFSAEYISLVTQNYLFLINLSLRKNESLHRDTIGKIITVINDEIAFEKENKMPYISTDERMNEKVIFRHGIFKKYFYSILFLKQDSQKDAVKIRQIYYALAAGIAMLFATSVVFYMQQKYGKFTAPFFAALVISYMFKDRIKDIFKNYFEQKLKIKAYDFRNKIYDMERQKLFGFIKERVQFIKKETISEDIKNTRLLNTDNRISTWFVNENILKYEKNITLINKNIKDAYGNSIKGITDIMRFDITRFTRKMDESKVPLYRVNQNNIYGTKVYHLNVVVDFSSEDHKNIHKIRLILTKKGIKRIEIPDGDIEIFPGNMKKRNKDWFPFKKDGSIKQVFDFKKEPQDG